ncbi:MAG: pantoate--beta-alanine ligase [Sterolibacterium sp.]|jgi:pantoate--beta-alanine ligase|nr:pantoate--beta-alanine ligase [Sterolibacterium sp.]
MKICETIASLRATLKDAGRIAFVPTMGNLHDGHIALMREARLHGDCVVASIFVNRLQFRPGEDFEKYPRTFAADCQRLEEAAVDVLFCPTEAEMYPQPQQYHIEPPTEHASILEGEFRPGHFRGVATVVAKLFNIVQPQAALLGRKDFQQLLVIRHMVQDLALPIEIIAGDTVRAADGLALSSRNGYLSTAERAEAPHLYRIMNTIREAIQRGEQNFAQLEHAAQQELTARGWKPDYIAIREKSGLKSPSAHDSGLVVLGAALLGSTRLIDNLEV